MRLLSKSSLYFILISIPVLIVAGVFSYQLIYKAVDENTKESLWNDKLRAEKIIEGFATPSQLILGVDSLSSIKIDSTSNTGYTYLESFRMDADHDEQIRFKTLKAYYRKGNTNYLITISRPTIEEDDLIENLISTLLLIISLLIISFFVLNVILSKSLWKPFNTTLGALNKFDIASGNEFKTDATSTSEFKNLNAAIVSMTQKLQRDYKLQKEFTENASHEMQTPLAVIKAKLEQLMQSPELKKDELELLIGIENSVNKLSSLNKSLLLLAKIENNQFESEENVAINEIIEKVLFTLDDYLTSKNIDVSVKFEQHPKLKINKDLLDILVGNLIQNAIRHNILNGKLKIVITEHELKISNTGDNARVNQEQLFERFKKGDASKESIGLGLSIIKSIVDKYNYKIKYSYEEDLHIFTLIF